MTLTMRELAGLGRLEAPAQKPSKAQLERHAALRPAVRDLAFAQAENDFLAANRDLQRAGDRRARCGEYLVSNRKPEDHGYSTGCELEASALEAASRKFSMAGDRLEVVREKMSVQRKASYEVDMQVDERDRALSYTRGPSGISLPTRGIPTRADAETSRAAEARGRRFPLVVGGLAFVGLAIFLATR